MQRKRMALFAALFAAGLIPGIYIGYQEAQAFLDGGSGAWSPTVSLAIVAVYLLAIVGGSVLLSGSMDEVERERSYKAVSFAGAVYIILYPVWFVLWKGGFVAEPIHWAAFVIFWLSLALSSLYYRFR